MGKQISAAELAQVVTTLLTAPESAGELCEAAQFSSFMTEIAEVVCTHCGGHVRHYASYIEDAWYVGIHDTAPFDPEAVWAPFDPEADL